MTSPLFGTIVCVFMGSLYVVICLVFEQPSKYHCFLKPCYSLPSEGMTTLPQCRSS